MILFKYKSDLKHYVARAKGKGLKIGFVPTMGALHEGHIQLVKEARKQCDIVVVSIFVNPTQFNDPKDFEKYPITVPADIEILEKNGATVLYLPGGDDIYPDGMYGLETYTLGDLEDVLEGAFRPGHFQGVCQVVNRLLQAVSPTQLFMGRKDFQQCCVIRKLLELEKLDIDLIICDTVREKDGLAMSSRNRRLNPEERANALTIYSALQLFKKELHSRPIAQLKEAAFNMLESKRFRIDYVEVARASDLKTIINYDPTVETVVLIAAFQGETRLIDNLLIPAEQAISAKH